MTDQPTDQPDDGTPPEPTPDRADQEPPPRRGEIRYQDPTTARPRPPSLADQRARQLAERRQAEREAAEQAEQQRKRKLRRRLMIGGGATAGVVAIVAIWYATAGQPDEVTAYCVAEDETVVDDANCDEQYVNTSGGYHSGGFFFIGGRQYHYYYGGNPTPLGGRVAGGTTVQPSNATVTTRSGKTIQRGGFGVRGGSGTSSGS